MIIFMINSSHADGAGPQFLCSHTFEPGHSSSHQYEQKFSMYVLCDTSFTLFSPGEGGKSCKYGPLKKEIV